MGGAKVWYLGACLSKQGIREFWGVLQPYDVYVWNQP